MSGVGFDLRLGALLRASLLGLGLAAAAQAGAQAGSVGPYSQLVVFGDSLSDPGNYYAAVGSSYPDVPFPLYSSGRFSNGKVAAEYLGEMLGLGSAQVKNYAWGGAMTGTENYAKYDPTMQSFLAQPGNEALKASFDATTQTGLLSQFGGYMAQTGGLADPNALYMVWGGANDFAKMQALGVSDPDEITQYVTTAAQNLAMITGGLLASGAQHILVPNMPDLGLTPGNLSQGPVAAAGASFLSQAFNSALNGYLDYVLATSPDPVAAQKAVIRFDTYGYLAQQAANPALNGFSNVSQQCIADPVCASDANNSYLFWDFQHPTTYGHQVLAGAFFAAAVPEPGQWLMLLGGLAVVAGLARRSRRV